MQDINFSEVFVSYRQIYIAKNFKHVMLRPLREKYEYRY